MIEIERSLGFSLGISAFCSWENLEINLHGIVRADGYAHLASDALILIKAHLKSWGELGETYPAGGFATNFPPYPGFP